MADYEQMRINLGKAAFEENQPHIVCVRNVFNDLEEELQKPEYQEKSENIDDYLYTDANGDQWGIFKLTPKECGRLMCVKEKDIDAILSVNSNSQAYKQFGNSICVNVLMGIFSQLNISGVTPWNDMTDDERYEKITDGCVLGECKESDEE